ncbi:MAG: peptidoglycan-binding domain-containing protein [Candidatus Pacebacteria bacterium]|nr:peptidoglycan-binding domain-containing protein [Candidatus Paceibacterota bacterium]
MSKLTKKIVAIATALTVSVMLVGPSVAQGETAAELQAQINSLLATLQSLQGQLTTLEGGTTTTGGTVTGCTITSFTRNLTVGSSGSDVKCLQIILNSDAATKVASSGAGSPGNETTYFGPLTKAAVIKFQEKYASEILTPLGLTAGTGNVATKTRLKLDTLISSGSVTPPAGCNCTAWANGACGVGGCITGQRQQTRTCTPAACALETQCVTDSTCATAPGAGLTVALSASNPAAATIVDDSTSADGAQSLIPALKVTFSNGDAATVKVTRIDFKRSGISSDNDISQAYIYDTDTDTWLADYNSFSSGVLTFSNGAGLFTIAAGGSKTVTLKFDLANGTASGKTVRFGVDAATNVASDASTVNGTFPLTGNYMSTAQATDLGKLTIATTTAISATIDPQEGVEVFNFSLAGESQKINVYKLKFTNIGSTAYTDLANFKLYDGGTQIGSTIASMNTDKTITFDLMASPIVIDKTTKQLHLKADIISGTNRTFQFAIRSMTDVLAYDVQYGVFIKPNKLDSWDISKTTAGVTTINTGKLTITRASDSPSGNIPSDGTSVSLAKFDLKATGEEVKITAMSVSTYGTIGGSGLYQMKVYFDGSQKGSTVTSASSFATDAAAAYTSFTFGNTFVVPVGTKTLEIIADVKDADGTSPTNNAALTVKIASITAEGRTSLASISGVTAAGFQLTIRTGTLSTALNSAVPNWTAVKPMSVPGATQALIGSYIVTAGASEGADITAVKIADDGTIAFSNFTNLNVYNGTKESGTLIGSTQSSLTTGSTYTFYPTPYISLAKSQSLTLNLYADVKTTTSTGDGGYTKLSEVDGTGKVTNTSVNYTTAVSGQVIYIGAAGSLTIAQDANTPKSALLVDGTAGVEFARVKFTGSVSEPISVTKMVVSETLDASAPSSTISNVSLWDAVTGAQVGSTQSFDISTGKATFDISDSPWSVPLGGVKYLSIKGDVNTYLNATSAGTVILGFAIDDVTYKGSISGTSATGSASAINGNIMYTYKTTVTAIASSAQAASAKLFNTTAQTVMIFDVTNNGSYDAYFNNATFTIAYTQGTGYATTQGPRTFYIYDATDLTTPIASTTIATSTTINAASFTPTLFGYSSGYTIPANSKKTFVLVGDLGDCGVPTTSAGSTIRFAIASGASFNWDDGVASAVESAYTKSFPIYGTTITF